MQSSAERAVVYQAMLDATDIPVYLIGSRKYFDRRGIYDDPATREGYPDNMERFVFFTKSGLELLPRLHAPSTSFTATTPTPRSSRDSCVNLRKHPFFAGAGTLLTIHNMAHQGIYPKESLAYAGIGSCALLSLVPL